MRYLRNTVFGGIQLGLSITLVSGLPTWDPNRTTVHHRPMGVRL